MIKITNIVAAVALWRCARTSPAPQSKDEAPHVAVLRVTRSFRHERCIFDRRPVWPAVAGLVAEGALRRTMIAGSIRRRRRNVQNRPNNRMGRILVLLLAACAFAAFPAHAQSVAEFYKAIGHAVVSSAPGGGYDALSRTVAPHSRGTFPATDGVVRNMSGAGGIVAVNPVQRRGQGRPPSSGNVQNNTPFEPLFGTKERCTTRSSSTGSARPRSRPQSCRSGTDAGHDLEGRALQGNHHGLVA